MANNPFDPPIVQVKKLLDRNGMSTVNHGFGSRRTVAPTSRPAPAPELPPEGVKNLSGLDDVDTTGATAGQILGFNGTAWAPVAASGGGGGGSTAVLSPADSAHPGDILFEPFTAPTLDAAWSQLNPGASISYTPGEYGLTVGLGSDSTQLRPITRSAPAGDFVVEYAVHELGARGGGYSGMVLAVLNGAGTQASTLASFTNGQNPVVSLSRQDYSPLSNRTSNEQWLSSGAYVFTAPFYIRLEVFFNGTSWRIRPRYSRTGQLWLGPIADSPLGFTPGLVGLSPYDRSGGGVDALVKWFRLAPL